MSDTPTSHQIQRVPIASHRQACNSPFVILFQERCGSTFLCSLLKSHTDICCRFEDFDLEPISGDAPADASGLVYINRKYYRRHLRTFTGPIDNPTKDDCVTHLRKIWAQPQPACGFKLKYEMQVAAYPEVIEELRWISRLARLLVLSRHNVLKQAVSRQNMERLLEQDETKNLTSKKSLPPLKLDVARAVKYARYVNAQRRNLEKATGHFHHVLQIWYEDLQNDPQEVMGKVLSFLEVEGQGDLSSNIHKATPDQLPDALENYDELAERVAGTELADMLE